MGKEFLKIMLAMILASTLMLTVNVQMANTEFSRSSGGLMLQMKVKQSSINLGENLEILLILKNVGTENISITFFSSQVFDLEFQGYKWSDDKVFAFLVWTLTLEPNEFYVKTLYWNLYRYDKMTGTYYPPNPGTWELFGYVIGQPSVQAVSLTVIVAEGRIYVPTPVSRPGEVNGDGKVDIYDIVLACVAYSSKKGDPNWNPVADTAPPWDRIDIYDVVVIAGHYGKRYS